jgi:hypothetical protein
MRVYTRINELIRYIEQFNDSYTTQYNGYKGMSEGSLPFASVIA